MSTSCESEIVLHGVHIERGIFMKCLLLARTCKAYFVLALLNPAGWKAAAADRSHSRLLLREALRRVRRGERSSGMRGESADG